MRRLPQVCHLEVKWSWEVDGGGRGDGNMWECTTMNEFQYSASMCSSTMRWAIWNVVRALQSRAGQGKEEDDKASDTFPFHRQQGRGKEDTTGHCLKNGSSGRIVGYFGTEGGSCEKRRRDKVKVGGKEGCARHTVGIEMEWRHQEVLNVSERNISVSAIYSGGINKC